MPLAHAHGDDGGVAVADVGVGAGGAVGRRGEQAHEVAAAQVGLQLEVMLDVRVGRREHPFVVVGVALVAGLGSIRRRRGDAATAGPSFEVGTAA